jgi:hypothetical protein
MIDPTHDEVLARALRDLPGWIDWRRTRNPVGRKDMDEDGAQ